MASKKVDTLIAFDKKYPGYGGFLPWFALNDDGTVTPTWDWINRVPSLDNGEYFWAVYGLVGVLETKYPTSVDLRLKWNDLLNKMVENAIPIFYEGQGKIRTVTKMTDATKSVKSN